MASYDVASSLWHPMTWRPSCGTLWRGEHPMASHDVASILWRPMTWRACYDPLLRREHPIAPYDFVWSILGIL